MYSWGDLSPLSGDMGIVRRFLAAGMGLGYVEMIEWVSTQAIFWKCVEIMETIRKGTRKGAHIRFQGKETCHKSGKRSTGRNKDVAWQGNGWIEDQPHAWSYNMDKPNPLRVRVLVFDVKGLTHFCSIKICCMR
jgi:hypothetical protein